MQQTTVCSRRPTLNPERAQRLCQRNMRPYEEWKMPRTTVS